MNGLLFPDPPQPLRTWTARCEECGNSFTSHCAENPEPKGLACPVCSVFRRAPSRIRFTLQTEEPAPLPANQGNT